MKLLLSLREFPIHKKLFFALLILLPTQVGLHIWPTFAIVLGRKIDYLSPTLFLTDLLLYGILLSWLFSGLNKLKKTRFSDRSTFLLLFVGGCVMGALSLTSLSPIVSLLAWIRILSLGFLTFYIYQTRPSFLFILRPLLVAGVFSALLGVWQASIGSSLGGIFWFFGERTFSLSTPGIAVGALCTKILPSLFPSCPEFLRAYGTFPHPNVLGGFLTISILLTLIYKQINPRLPIIYTGAVFICVIGLLATASRSSVLALSLGIVLLYVRQRIFQILMILCALGITIIPLSPTQSFFSDYESIVVRQDLTRSAMNIIKTHLLVGVGLNNFIIALPSYLPSRSIYFLQPVHNIFLLFLAETGVLGCTFLLLILLIVYKRIVSAKLSGKQLINPLVIIIPLIIIGMVDHYFLTIQQARLMVTIALATILLQVTHSSEKK